GWLRLHGQRMGVYGFELGTALLVASTTVIFLALIYWTAHSLNRLEEARGRASSKFKTSEDRLNLALRSSGVGTSSGSHADDTVSWNDHMGPLRGFSPEPHQFTHDAALRSVPPEDRE